MQYYNTAKSLKWEIKDGLKFSDDNSYRWISPDIDAVDHNTLKESKGGWITKGVSPPHAKLKDNQCGHHGIWGVAYNGCWYSEKGGNWDGANKIDHDSSNLTHLFQKNMNIDILLAENRSCNYEILYLLCYDLL